MKINQNTVSWFRHGVALFILMILSGFYAEHLGQTSTSDFKNYHWYNAYSFIHHRFYIDIGVASKQNYINPLLDVANYFIIQYFSNPRIAEFVLGTLHGIAVFFLLNIGLILFKKNSYKWFYAITATLIGVTGVASLYQIGSTYNESQVSIFIMASLFIFTKAIVENSRNYYQFCLAGFILGLGVALKMTAISYAVGMFASLCCYRKPSREHFKLILLAGISSLIGFFIAEGFWMWKLYERFHNPLYPYYNNIFHSPYAVKKVNVADEFIPPNFLQAILYPFHLLKENMLTSRFPFKEPRFAVAIILGLLLLGKLSYQKLILKQTLKIMTPGVFFILLFFCFSYIIWMKQFSIYRYTIPLNFLTGIIIVFFSEHIFKLPKIQIIFIIIITVLIIQQTKIPNWDRTVYQRHFFMIETSKPLPTNSLILVASRQISYITTFFPESNRFLGYYNWLINPFNKQIYREVLEIINQFHGPIYALYTNEGEKTAITNLALNDFKVEDNCQIIKSNQKKNVYFKLCLLKRE